jgi:hypothetical protein
LSVPRRGGGPGTLVMKHFETAWQEAIWIELKNWVLFLLKYRQFPVQWTHVKK